MKRATFKGATEGMSPNRVRVEGQTFTRDEPVEVSDSLAERLEGLAGFKFTISQPRGSGNGRRSRKTDKTD